MNLKLEKENRGQGYAWYRITINDKYIDGSLDFERIKKKFDEIKANPNILKNEKEVLYSEEI